jgi:hypothetical protein
MQTNFEQAVEVIKSLPPEDFQRFDEWYEEQKQLDDKAQEKKQQLAAELKQYKKARKWINENSEKYMNQWVCLEGDKLIAHGTDGLQVHKEAVAKGIKSPFLHHIVDESLPFGGW